MASSGFPSVALRDDWNKAQSEDLDAHVKDLPPVSAERDKGLFDNFVQGLGSVGDRLKGIQDTVGGFMAPPPDAGVAPGAPPPPPMFGAVDTSSIAPPSFGAPAQAAAPPPIIGDSTAPSMPVAPPGEIPVPPPPQVSMSAGGPPESGVSGPSETPITPDTPYGPTSPSPQEIDRAWTTTRQREMQDKLSALPDSLMGAGLRTAVQGTIGRVGQGENVAQAAGEAITAAARADDPANSAIQQADQRQQATLPFEQTLEESFPASKDPTGGIASGLAKTGAHLVTDPQMMIFAATNPALALKMAAQGVLGGFLFAAGGKAIGGTPEAVEQATGLGFNVGSMLGPAIIQVGHDINLARMPADSLARIDMSRVGHPSPDGNGFIVPVQVRHPETGEATWVNARYNTPEEAREAVSTFARNNERMASTEPTPPERPSDRALPAVGDVRPPPGSIRRQESPMAPTQAAWQRVNAAGEPIGPPRKVVGGGQDETTLGLTDDLVNGQGETLADYESTFKEGGTPTPSTTDMAGRFMEWATDARRRALAQIEVQPPLLGDITPAEREQWIDRTLLNHIKPILDPLDNGNLQELLSDAQNARLDPMYPEKPSLLLSENGKPDFIARELQARGMPGVEFYATADDIPAPEVKPLGIGDTFTQNGHDYELDLVESNGTVEAIDPRRPTIRRGWVSIEDFENETGQRIAPELNPALKEGQAAQTQASAAALPQDTPADVPEAPAEVSDGLMRGDTFEHGGRRYQLSEANNSGVRAMDLTGRMPIQRAWESIDSFQNETGQKIAGQPASAPEVAPQTATPAPVQPDVGQQASATEATPSKFEAPFSVHKDPLGFTVLDANGQVVGFDHARHVATGIAGALNNYPQDAARDLGRARYLALQATRQGLAEQGIGRPASTTSLPSAPAPTAKYSGMVPGPAGRMVWESMAGDYKMRNVPTQTRIEAKQDFNKHYEAGLNDTERPMAGGVVHTGRLIPPVAQMAYDAGVKDSGRPQGVSSPQREGDAAADQGPTDAGSARADDSAPLADQRHSEVAGDAGEGTPAAGAGSGEGDAALRGQHGEQRTSTSGSDVRSDEGHSAGLTEAVHDAPTATSAVEQALDDVPGSDSPSAQHTEQTARGRDYVITEADELGHGGPKEKAAKNIAAIRLLKELESAGRLATPAEQSILVKYVGWGDTGFEYLFSDRSDYRQPWEKQQALRKEREEFRALVSDEEWAAMLHSRLNAHYTSDEVIPAMWSAVRRLGVADGSRLHWLESAAGIGHFFGLQPADLAAKSIRTGIELDKVTGGLLRQLYQAADIYGGVGYQKAPIPPGKQDMMMSNVPFGSYGVSYLPFGKRLKPMTELIHNFFIGKALYRDVRPGGLVAVITSAGTLNAKDPKVRQLFYEQGDLLGAVRLPRTAFKDNAGTEVVTDIVFFRRRLPGEPPGGEAFINVGPVLDENGQQIMEVNDDHEVNPILVNEYFLNHPEMVLGKHSNEGSMYRANQYTVLPREGETLAEGLRAAIENLPAGAVTPALEAEDALAPPQTDPRIVNATKPYAYVDQGGVLKVREGYDLVPVDLPKASIDRIRGMLGIRDIAREYNGLQREGAAEADIVARRADLNKAYDAFVKKNGPLNDGANRRLMGNDPDGRFLLGLENWDPATQGVVETHRPKAPVTKWSVTDGTLNLLKMPMFHESLLVAAKPATSAATLKDAVALSSNEFGSINLNRIAQLMGQPVKRVRVGLLTQELAFENPMGDLEPADLYLSGNVRDKLRAAEIAAEMHPDMKRNVDALKEVIPEDIPPSHISAPFGAPWVPAEVVNNFIEATFKVSDNYGHDGQWFRYVPDAGMWVSTHQPDYMPQSFNDKWSIERTGRNIKGWDILSAAIEGKDRYEVSYKNDDGKYVLDEVASTAATEKLRAIKQAWGDWLWSDVDRADRLARIYNDVMNATVPWRPDGSHLTLPGASPKINIYPHQKDGVWRVIQQGTALLAWQVGYGKSFAMAAAAMELRRLGLARRPLIVVPKSLVEQMAGEFTKLYPDANLLVPGEHDFNVQNRNVFTSRIMSGDWDGIVISYEQFMMLPMRPENATVAYREAIEAIDRVIAFHKDKDKRSAQKGRDFTSKELANMRAKYAKQIQDYTDRVNAERDTTNFFEDLGIDQLFVDEAHNFKRLFFPTQLDRVKGLSTDGSDRAFDMVAKTNWLLRQNGGRGVVFATGTPISNTIAETWTMMRYLMPDRLADLGIETFDAFATTFTKVTTDVEMDATGRFRSTNRLAAFQNAPELSNLFQTVTDIRMGTEMPEMEARKPHIYGGERPGDRTIVDIEAPQSLLDYQKELIHRVEHMPPPRKGGDGHLKVWNDAKDAALDIGLIDPKFANEPNSKISVAAKKIAEVYQETAADKGAQLVFMDRGIPRENAGKDADESQAYKMDDTPETAASAANVYQRLKKRLVNEGIAPKEIAFIQDAKNKSQLASLFAKVRSGEIRVLIGSTEKMGAGVNVQERLAAVHHLTFTWSPAWMEQREGRLLRPGNAVFGPIIKDGKVTDPGKGVRIFAYVVKGSFDANMANLLFVKMGFMKAIMRQKVTDRSIGDVDDVQMNYAEMRAIASGNPYASRFVQLEGQVRQLHNLLQAHEQANWHDRSEQASTRATIASLKDAQKELPKAVALAEKNPKFSITVGKDSSTDRKDGWVLLGDWLKTHQMPAYSLESGNAVVPFGKFRGFDLGLRVHYERPDFAGAKVPVPHGIAFSVKVPGEDNRWYSTTAISLKGAPSIGWLDRLENVVDGFPGAVRDVETGLTQNEARLGELDNLLAVNFSHVTLLGQTDRAYDIVGRLLREEAVTPEEREWFEQRERQAAGGGSIEIGADPEEAISASAPPAGAPEEQATTDSQSEAEAVAHKLTEDQMASLTEDADALEKSGLLPAVIMVRDSDGASLLQYQHNGATRLSNPVAKDGKRWLDAASKKLDPDLTDWHRAGQFLPEPVVEAPPETPAVTDETPAEGEHKYDHGSTQIDLPDDLATQMRDWAHANIPESDLAPDGYEDEPHITVRYGLTGDDPAGDLSANAYDSAVIRFGKTGIFEAPEHDVVYVSVKAPALNDLRNDVEVATETAEDTHGGYTPHATLAYVKKGLGRNYEGLDVFGNSDVDSFRPTEMMVSDRDGVKTAIPIGRPEPVKPAEALIETPPPPARDTAAGTPPATPETPVTPAAVSEGGLPQENPPEKASPVVTDAGGEPPEKPPEEPPTAMAEPEDDGTPEGIRDRLIAEAEKASDGGALDQIAEDANAQLTESADVHKVIDAVVKGRGRLGIGARDRRTGVGKGTKRASDRTPPPTPAATPTPAASTPPTPATPPPAAAGGGKGGGKKKGPAAALPGGGVGPYVNRLFGVADPDVVPLQERFDRAYRDLKRTVYDRVNFLKEVQRVTGIPTYGYARFMGGAAAHAENVVEHVFKPAMQPIKRDLDRFQEYLVGLHAQDIRAARPDSLLPNGIIDPKRDTKELLDHVGPEKATLFKDKAKFVHDFQKETLDLLVEADMLDPERRDDMESLYPNYIWYGRQGYDLANEMAGGGGPSSGKGGPASYKSQPIKRMLAQGSERKLDNPLAHVAANRIAIANAIARNNSAKTMADAYDELQNIEDSMAKAEGRKPEKIIEHGHFYPDAAGNMVHSVDLQPTNTKGIIWFRKNGGKLYYARVDMEAAIVANNMAAPAIGATMRIFIRFIRFAQALSAGFRQGNTMFSPDFIVGQAPKDLWEMYMRGGSGPFDKGYWEAWKAALAPKTDANKLYWEASEAGAFTSSHNGYESLQDLGFRPGARWFGMIPVPSPLDILTLPLRVAMLPLRPVAKVARSIEEAHRIANYVKMLKPLGAKSNAAMMAYPDMKDANIDFDKRGDLGPFLNVIQPFFNVALQAGSNVYRTFRDDMHRPGAGAKEGWRFPWRTLLKLMLPTTAISIMVELWNSQWKSSEDIANYAHVMYWPVQYGEETQEADPKHPGAEPKTIPLVALIPKPGAASVLTAAPEMIMRMMRGGKDHTLQKEAMQAAWHFEYGLSPVNLDSPMIHPLVATFAQIKDNRDWFKNQEIVTPKELTYPAEDQYGPGTTRGAILIGRELGWSPKNVDFFINNFFGGAGRTESFFANLALAPFMDKNAPGDAYQREQSTMEQIGQTPILRKFVRPAGGQTQANEYQDFNQAVADSERAFMADPAVRRLGIALGPVGTSILKGKLELTPGERAEYQRATGRIVQEHLSDLTSDDRFLSDPPDTQKRLIQALIAKAHLQAQKEVVQDVIGEDAAIERVNARQMARAS